MRKLPGAIAAFIYMNLLPYLCRLPKGTDWAGQYLPDEGHLLDGLLFFHFFYSIPAVLLVISIYTSKQYAIPFIATFLALTIITVYGNYDYDLASDAQAAIGLVMMPILACWIGAIAFGVGLAIQYGLVKKARHGNE